MTVYHIFRTDTNESCTRKRIDAAQSRLERMVYDAIRAHAGLATLWGHRVMREAQEWDWRDDGTINAPYFHIFCAKSRC